MALAFISVMWWRVVAFVFLLGFALLYRPGASSFSCPSGQRSIVAFMRAPFTCGRSFSVCSGWGVLSFLEFFSVFLPPSSPFISLLCFISLHCLLLLLFH